MHIGLNLPVIVPGMTALRLLELTQRAELLGFTEVYLGEHAVLFDELDDAYPGASGKLPFPSDTPMPDPLVLHAYLAGATSTIRLATGVLLLPQRNPVYTAKHVSTLDWLSGGRVDISIGLGWSRQEFAALGVPWRDRGPRCDEYVDVLKALWAPGPSTFSGRFYELPTCRQDPKPIQSPHPPLWFGGMSDAALERVAKRGDGWYAFGLTPARLAPRLAVLDQLLADQGRTRDEISIVVGVLQDVPRTREDLIPYAELGVDQFVVSMTGGDPAELDDMADRLLRDSHRPL